MFFVTVDSTLTVWNSDLSHGDAEWAGCVACFIGATCEFVNVTMDDCQAGSDGGAIYFSGAPTAGTLTGCELDDCDAGDDGGCIYISDATVELHDVGMHDCEASDAGGAVRVVNDGILTATDLRVSDCVAKVDGGAVHAQYQTTVDIVGCTMTNNQADEEGGDFWFGDDVVASISHCVIQDAHASPLCAASDDDTLGGSIFVSDDASVTASFLVVDGAKADRGGVIAVTDRGVLEVLDSSFTDSTAEDYGGVLFAEDDADVVLRRCSSDGSSAERGGGACCCCAAALSVVARLYRRSHARGVPCDACVGAQRCTCATTPWWRSSTPTCATARRTTAGCCT